MCTIVVSQTPMEIEAVELVNPPTESSSSASLCLQKINDIITSIEDSLATSWSLEHKLFNNTKSTLCKDHKPDCIDTSNNTPETLNNLYTNLNGEYSKLKDAYEKLSSLYSNQSDKLLKYEMAIERLRKKNKVIQADVIKREKTITRVCSKYLELRKVADDQEMQINHLHQEKLTLKHKLKIIECKR